MKDTVLIPNVPTIDPSGLMLWAKVVTKLSTSRKMETFLLRFEPQANAARSPRDSTGTVNRERCPATLESPVAK
jgi:hypothetical protein